jgi:hypothetical protein
MPNLRQVADLVAGELHHIDVIRGRLFAGRLARTTGTGMSRAVNGLHPRERTRPKSAMNRFHAPQQLVAFFNHLVGAQLTIPPSWAGLSGLGNTGLFSRA